MNPAPNSEFNWTMRMAPYYLAAGLVALITSLFWIHISVVYILISTLLAAFGLYFQILFWRGGREIFRILLAVGGVLPSLLVMTHLHGLATIQYAALLMTTFYSGMLFLKRRIVAMLADQHFV